PAGTGRDGPNGTSRPPGGAGVGEWGGKVFAAGRRSGPPGEGGPGARAKSPPGTTRPSAPGRAPHPTGGPPPPGPRTAPPAPRARPAPRPAPPPPTRQRGRVPRHRPPPVLTQPGGVPGRRLVDVPAATILVRCCGERERQAADMVDQVPERVRRARRGLAQ